MRTVFVIQIVQLVMRTSIQYTYIVGKYKIYCTAEGADKYETGTNVTGTTKKTPLTTLMKDEKWRLFLSFLLKSDKFSDFFDIVG
jgi:hypothetical protein